MAGAVEEPAHPAAAKVMPARRVLMVDDDEAIAELLHEVAGRIGFVTTIVHGGDAAKAEVATHAGRFDAILCDIRMPSGDGPAFYDWLQAEYPPLARRIGFVTGDTLEPLAGRFLARAGCPMLEKPFVLDDVRFFLADLTKTA